MDGEKPASKPSAFMEITVYILSLNCVHIKKNNNVISFMKECERI